MLFSVATRGVQMSCARFAEMLFFLLTTAGMDFIAWNRLHQEKI